MSNMNEDTMSKIYSKHAAALAAVAQGAAWIALALAMHEMNKPVDRRIHEQVMAQILRLNEWLAENAIDLYQDGTTDTGEAMVKAANRLAAQLAQVRTELAAAIDHYRDEADQANTDLNSVMAENKALIAERDALRQQLARMDADNAALIAERDKLSRHFDNAQSKLTALVNGSGSDLGIVPSPSNGIDWSGLSEKAQDWRIGLDKTRWKYSQVPRPIRLELFRCVCAHLEGQLGRAPMQSEFDAARPGWMSSSTSHTQTLGQAWTALIDRTIEIEVAP